MLVAQRLDRLSSTSISHLTRLVTDEKLSDVGFQYFDGEEARPPSPDAQRDDYARALWADANRLIGLADDEVILAAG